MKRTLWILFISICFFAACGNNTAEWQERYDLGVEYFAEKNYEDAVSAFTEAIQIDPEQQQAFISRGDAYVMLDDHLEDALADYEQALQLDESCIEGYIGLADVYLYEGNVESATSILDKGYAITENEALSHRREEIAELKFPMEVCFERKEHSVYSDNEQMIAEFYYDLPSVSEDYFQGRKINDDFYKVYSEYLREIENLKEEESFDIDGAEYFYTWTGRESYSQDGILSLYFCTDWCMGGVHNFVPRGFTYDFRTGDRMNLQDVFEIDSEKLLMQIKNRITQYARVNVGGSYQAEEKEKIIEGYTLESLDFYISREGELIICIPVYELGNGSEGSFEIPCGIYVNPLQSEQANVITDDGAVFAADFIGETVDKLSQYYGKSYFLDIYEGSSYVEYSNSPCFFLGIIAEAISGDETVTMVYTAKDDVLLDKLTGNMTYPEIIEALGNSVELEQPTYYENLMEDTWMYSLSFNYKGYRFSYSWYGDPQTTKSNSASVSLS